MSAAAPKNLDKAGIWITTVCAIHCLLLPVILPLLALAGFAFIGEDLLENSILGLSVVVGLWSLVGGARRHGKWWLLAFLIAGAAIYSQRDILGPWGEPVIILVGAGLIIYAHLSNLRLNRKFNFSAVAE
ncbi:MerC domain-containing protein [Idiomarina sp. HP20-50]|uniref:MerC domain-containing protein n=1 Tax=Idiomarina sp. HP20-50 TaxID=3070813 RepID=UPI00294AA2D5|nr:MerC domain-containing protein [Idiomarina sp. HP20-50]MDV6316832.1 MerC domain-containing protein [Idiomarina sp. HP20-50]